MLGRDSARTTSHQVRSRRGRDPQAHGRMARSGSRSLLFLSLMSEKPSGRQVKNVFWTVWHSLFNDT